MAQTGNWEEAARCHMQASAMLEASMDAFMRACRIQQLSDGQEDDSI